MKKYGLIILCVLYSILFAELVNLNPDPSGEPWIVGGVSNLTEEQAEFVSRIQILPEPENWDADKSFLDSVDNSALPYFRPVFNQEGFGSCGQASGIGYAFTYEMNSKRNTSAAIDPSVPESDWYLEENSHNWYPPHFTYNFLNEGTYYNGSWFFEGWNIVKQMGIPDVHTYGGMWPTEIAEPYEDTSEYKLRNSRIWMNGYDNYKTGMVNRVLDYYYIPVNTPSGLNLLKQWMNDYCDGTDHGGIATFAAGFPDGWGTNEEFNMVNIVGLPGEGVKYSVITHWGHDEANHAMTFVGYDDEFEWDYDREIYIDNQGIEHVIPPSNHEWEWDSVTETLIQTTEKPMSEWEVGALIMVNSWGRSWGVGGKAFVPYRLLGLPFGQGGIYDYSSPGDGGIRKNSVFVMKAVESYPSLSVKTEIDYSVRSNLGYTVGVSNNIESTSPQNAYNFDLYNKRNGQVGMSGIGDVLEIGFDASMLLPYITKDINTKFFFGVNSSTSLDEPQGNGYINIFSLYYNEEESISFDSPAEIQPDATIWMSAYHTVTPETFYVNNDSGDNNFDGLSPDTPFKTISKAISASPPGSTVMLAGTFTLTDDLGVGDEGLKISKSLEIIGESPENTIIQGKAENDNRKLRVFTIEAVRDYTEIYLKNVTIRNGEIEDNGGGIYLTGLGKLSLENCNIESNMSNTASGGGIYSRGLGNLILNNCEVCNNIAEVDGGGIYASGIKDASFNNCVIKGNLSCNGNGHAVYIYSKWEERTFFDRCNISQNGLNYSGDPQLGINGSSAVFFNSVGSSLEALTIDNSSFVNNYSKTNGGALTILQSVGEGNYYKIRNCTFSENNSANLIGHGIYVQSGQNNSTEINSCTITYNGNDYSSQGSAVFYRKQTREWAFFEIKNSILKNPGELNFASINLSYSAIPAQFSRSYTISNDGSIPVYSDPPEYNDCTVDLITDLRFEDYTYFHKIIAGSPAKDAIPKGSDPNNPFNGAGTYIVELDENGDPVTDGEGNFIPILDEYGNIQVLDQRGFNVWNKNKDIGAYESPYYWVDVADEDQYITIPNWRTKLTIADPVEGWTDYMRAQTGGRITLSDNSEIIREDGSELHWYDGSYMDVDGDARIRNGIDFVSNANVNILDGDQLSLLNSNTTIPASASFKIGNDSKFVLEGESAVTFANGLNIESNENAEISLYGPSSLNADGVTFSYTGTEGGKWLGINCNSESFVDLNNVHISGAVTGVKGFYNNKFEVTNSVFENCDNGIMVTELVDNVNYVITGNSLTGTSSGTGISITDSNGRFRDNSIEYFYVGANFTLCSPEIAKNTIEYNKAYGILISGQNAIPQLINTDLNQVYNELNNTVANNGNTNLGTLIFPSSQIGIRPYSNVYMQNGHNNVYRGEFNIQPAVPCISIENKVSQITSGIIVNAQNNFWGSEYVTDDFFDGHYQYSIIYEPYSPYPYPFTGTNPNNPQSAQTTENKILTNAMKLEDKGNYRAAINLYELVIRKYEDSPEYYVAMARLPYLYSMLEEDNNILIAAYDEAYESENTTNKKFFKGMKVATHIKGKRYDDAIIVAEEMKNEAEFEEEIILADINIAIANTLKNLNSKGKGKNTADDIQTLISKLTGNGEKNEPADMSETFIPEKTVLHQNYPNPFNPVTQIKFDLAKTGNVKLSIYNVSGQKVAELADGIRNAGFHIVEFDGSKFNSGIYYYTLEVDGKNITKKMVLTK